MCTFPVAGQTASASVLRVYSSELIGNITFLYSFSLKIKSII
jgi:hypothetical protein